MNCNKNPRINLFLYLKLMLFIDTLTIRLYLKEYSIIEKEYHLINKAFKWCFLS